MKISFPGLPDRRNKSLTDLAQTGCNELKNKTAGRLGINSIFYVTATLSLQTIMMYSMS